ncbi:MAG TPA: hypothetical protein VHB20_17410 [Verrucomicrobiae bacterium]|jgi:phenylacetic acid degradation operon negative regulatory protein|nr:hypothetical protein [Verrucomicrobiae bacterium]
MKPKTEEFLNFLLWSATLVSQPTSRNLSSSFESWAYRQGLRRQAHVLRRKKFVESEDSAGDRLYRLTAEGRLHALGGRNPLAQWGRAWDGQWRIVVFDIPTAREAYRMQLWRRLKERSFGYLQGSVWVTPDSVGPELKRMEEGVINVKSLLLLEGRPCAGESDAEIVNGAWDFKQINHRYQQHMKVLAERPERNLQTEAAAKELQQWAAKEREAWLHAVRWDPLLPEQLWPKGYLGPEAWKRKMQAFRQASRQAASFSL